MPSIPIPIVGFASYKEIKVVFSLLSLGWTLIVISFGKAHHNRGQTLMLFCNSDYVVLFLQYWIFIFGAPVSVLFTGILSLTNNKTWRKVWGSAVHISLCTTSVALGGCFSGSIILLINATSEKILHAYFIVGLVGEVLSLLGLFVIFGIGAVVGECEHVEVEESSEGILLTEQLASEPGDEATEQLVS